MGWMLEEPGYGKEDGDGDGVGVGVGVGVWRWGRPLGQRLPNSMARLSS